MGPLGPMVRVRALVPVALGRACCLPPNGFGCQPQGHLCVPMVPTGRMGNLRLGRRPCHGIMELVFGEARRRGQRPATGHHTQKQISAGGVCQMKDKPRHFTTWGFLCYEQHMSSGCSPVILFPNLCCRSSHQCSAKGEMFRKCECMGSFFGIVQ